ncbi:glycoside hydrolase family 3 C-terminal domain-containing protein [Alloiococcus sp. CFN-8]|uniref:glycoside hydrolase family 3 C-terminal domain-containing protein n=1 Tax=Alloiococcus sp. CFN-8 TaxID=3416081 RepID=UPI003CEAEE7C
MQLRDNKEQINEYKKRAKDLVGKMTLVEKVFQMLHDAPAIERLGIPAYNWWNEGLHGVARAGVATMFPQAIALAAAFDEDMMETLGDAIATEARAKFNIQQEYGDHDIYKGLTMWSPNINIFRDPRWGRGHETYGEDPYLTSRLGVRYVEGMQGKDPNYLKVAACAKHFAVHSGPEELRHEFDARVTQQDLYETYLPAFQSLVQEAGVESVMGAYNRVNGEPCNGSKTLLKDILRDKWGFDGHVVTDCWAIKDFYEGHHVTSGPIDSVALAVSAGCDVNCGTLFVYLVQAVEEGLISEDIITQACERLFTTRMKLGIFDDKKQVPFNQIPYSVVDSDEMKKLNLEIAEKTLVLLKNKDNMLPLKKEEIRTIGVIGPNANNRRALQGNYEGTASRYVTVLEGIQDYLGEDVRVLYSEGCHLYKKKVSALARDNDRISEVKAVCNESDVIIACLGLDADLEGEEGDTGNEFASGDKPNLSLPGLQQELLETIYSCGKPVVLVLLSGSALAVSWADEHIPAIIQGWYPGSQGGTAIARTLFGDSVPEGKLPVTFYRTTEELPEFTDYSMKNRTYRYMNTLPLYPFGYGLSYTDYEISQVQVSNESITEEGIKVSCHVKNSGKYAGRTTVQAYVKAEQDGTPNPQLKGMKKLELQPGEVKEVSIFLPLSAFSLCNEDGIRKVEKGTYTIYIGESQPDARSRELTGKEPINIVVKCNETIDCS